MRRRRVVKRVRLQMNERSRRNAVSQACSWQLASRLTKKAWDITSAEVVHSRLQKRSDGAAYLLSFLEEWVCKTPVPIGRVFHETLSTTGASMTEWATSLRESCRRLQTAVARQRQQSNPGSVAAAESNSRRPSASSPRPAHRSDRTTPQARQDAPAVFPEILQKTSPGRAGQRQENPNDCEVCEELPQSEHGGSEQ